MTLCLQWVGVWLTFLHIQGLSLEVKGLIRLASPTAPRFNISLFFLFSFFLFLLCPSQKKHTSYIWCARKPRRLESAVRGSEVNSLNCEALGGSNPLSGPLETLLRASYRELQPPAIQNIPPPPQPHPPQNIGRSRGRREGWLVKRLTRVNHIREVEKQRVRPANKPLGRRKRAAVGMGSHWTGQLAKEKVNRKLFLCTVRI